MFEVETFNDAILNVPLSHLAKFTKKILTLVYLLLWPTCIGGSVAFGRQKRYLEKVFEDIPIMRAEGLP
jgi:hypothetical protein